MKMKLVKSIIIPLMVACASLPVVAATAAKEGTQGGRIQGVWETQITLNDCSGHVIRSFQGMLTFHQGGTMMEWHHHTVGSEDACRRGLATCHEQYLRVSYEILHL